MNKNKLKSYAPAARRDFIQAVTDRAHFYGLSEKEIIPVEVSGDVAIIGGRPFPRAVAAQRKKLEERVKREGFSQVMEAVAYTWFNRFLALRYMELHGYLEHGFRVLSNTGSSTVPEILDHAAQLDLPGLNKQKVVELKLDGSKDAELYRLLLVAQCNALHAAMSFLFEKIEDETELLLPDNLLHSDSLIRKLVTEIDEDDWQEVEIIGWLYQFYISEKKGQVIGKVVKSEDIPAATQLFTPNWIVKYMVQNSLGRQWLATYPVSPLKAKMKYFIEPAVQTEMVKSQLAAITPESLDPEKLTVLDPASGSGHILVEAYDVFKEIYLERGYSNRDFPRLILEKNLFGLDIDDRAAQMAGFALLMKARKDDRRILRSDIPIKMNVMSIKESTGLTIENSLWGEHANHLHDLLNLFRNSKTFGSLIQVPNALTARLPALKEFVKKAAASEDLYVMQAANEMLPLVEQAIVLAGKYDCVVANPPYMGAKNAMESTLKAFANKEYSNSKNDLFAMFMVRGWSLARPKTGLNAMVVMESWMFISSFEKFREHMLSERTVIAFTHMPYEGRGPTTMGISFGTIAIITSSEYLPEYNSHSCCVRYSDIDDDGVPFTFPVDNSRLGHTTPSHYKKVPGSPFAYWASEKLRDLYSSLPSLGEIADPQVGLQTSDNPRFLRYWHEVDVNKIKFNCTSNEEAKVSGGKWFPHHKGGDYRRWYGNRELVVNWENDGQEIKDFVAERYPYLNGNIDYVVKDRGYFFREGITWSHSTSGAFSCRYVPEGSVSNVEGPTIFADGKDVVLLTGLLNSSTSTLLLGLVNATLHYLVGMMRLVPVPYAKLNAKKDKIEPIILEAISLTRTDWDSFETSWDFLKTPLLDIQDPTLRLADLIEGWHVRCQQKLSRLQFLEECNNKFFIELYGLQDELSSEVSEGQITLARANRELDLKRLISYAIGCMMGRYSLDQPGLIYASSNNIGFDQSKYHTFPADDDGIIPIMDMDWFPDDAASRIEEFLKVTWSPETLEENLKFVADSLSPKGGETPRETIRRYISTQFFKDHLQTYKKRPIYWLFSSGKQRAFECLVYLHRYNESTLSRMRNEYVTPLQGKFSAQVDYLVNEVNAATSTAERNRLQKQLDILRKKQVELAAFDDLLRHYADQRISLDLDDGVKVNYGKFGALLAEVKVVTGGGE